MLQSHVSSSLQDPNNLFINYLSSKLPFTVNHWLLVLVAFQILSHSVITLSLFLISKLPEGISILLICPFIFFRFPNVLVAGLFSFLDQILQSAHARKHVDEIDVFLSRLIWTLRINRSTHQRGEVHQPLLLRKPTNNCLHIAVDADTVMSNKSVDIGMLQNHILQAGCPPSGSQIRFSSSFQYCRSRRA